MALLLDLLLAQTTDDGMARKSDYLLAHQRELIEFYDFLIAFLSNAMTDNVPIDGDIVGESVGLNVGAMLGASDGASLRKRGHEFKLRLTDTYQMEHTKCWMICWIKRRRSTRIDTWR